MGDYSVTARQMTKLFEEENLVVFVDRAGYGFSDDTENEITLEYIVKDYRKALKNAESKMDKGIVWYNINRIQITKGCQDNP